MKRLMHIVVACAVMLASLLPFAACGRSSAETVVLIPETSVGQARALFLLQSIGWIRLRDGADITATPADVIENPYQITLQPTADAQFEKAMQTAAYAVPETQTAYSLALNSGDIIAREAAFSTYPAVITVRRTEQRSALMRALAAAAESTTVADYIKYTYGDLLVSAAQAPGSGVDPAVDYTELIHLRLTVAAYAKPQAEILTVIAQKLREQNIELVVKEYDHPQKANEALAADKVDAVFMQDAATLEADDAAQAAQLVSVAQVYTAPLCVYRAAAGTQALPVAAERSD